MYYLSIYSDPDTLNFIRSECHYYESREEMKKRLSMPHDYRKGKLEVFVNLRSPVALLLFDKENFADLFQHETIEDAINSLKEVPCTLHHDINLNSIYYDDSFLLLAPKHMIEKYVGDKKIETCSYSYGIEIMFFVLVIVLLVVKCFI